MKLTPAEAQMAARAMAVYNGIDDGALDDDELDAAMRARNKLELMAADTEDEVENEYERGFVYHIDTHLDPKHGKWVAVGTADFGGEQVEVTSDPFLFESDAVLRAVSELGELGTERFS
jgi:hypothetical protein